MSRYKNFSSDRRYEVAYGYDPVPMGGYFFQVFDRNAINETNDEGVIVDEGLMPGIPSNEMLAHLENLEKWNIKLTDRIAQHKVLVALDMPI